jgi:hypothetical protein
MTKANAALALSPDERPPDYQPQQQQPQQEELNLKPGAILELERLGTLHDEIGMALADLKLGKAQGDWAIFEAAAFKLAGLAEHLRKTITQVRPRPPHRSPSEKE